MAPGNYGDHKRIGILSIVIRFVFEVGNHGKVPYRFKASLWHAGCHWLRIRAWSEHSVRLVARDSSIVGGFHQWFGGAGGWLQFSPWRLGGGGGLRQWRHCMTSMTSSTITYYTTCHEQGRCQWVEGVSWTTHKPPTSNQNLISLSLFVSSVWKYTTCRCWHFFLYNINIWLLWGHSSHKNTIL